MKTMPLLRPLPDPRQLAATQAAAITGNRTLKLEEPLLRKLAETPWLNRDEVIAGTLEFHKERMERVPSKTEYPESAPWVELTRETDRLLRGLVPMTDAEFALLRSLDRYLAFRSKCVAPPSPLEKCRALFLPDSDHGRILIKNLDETSAHWKPRPPITAMPKDTLGFEGVGSGLHFDEEPAEIFPLNPCQMLGHYCHEVPGAVEFLRRYSAFWGWQNLLLYDAQGRSAAIEKCSFSFCEVFEPDAQGRSHISGMVCRDPHSPQAEHQRAVRKAAIAASGRCADNSPDAAFWRATDALETKLVSSVAAWGDQARLADVIELFTTPYPDGLNKENARFHPDQPVDAWTLATTITLPEEGRILRWQRAEGTMAWPTKPEVYQFRTQAD